MPITTLDIRRRNFARNLAAGMSLEDAHKQAGFSGNRGNAHTMSQEPDIQDMLADYMRQADEQALQQRAKIMSESAGKQSVTKQWIMDRLVDVVQSAGEKAQFGAVNRALELLGKELSMFVDRRELTVRRLADLSTEELRSLVLDLEAEEIGEPQALPKPEQT